MKKLTRSSLRWKILQYITTPSIYHSVSLAILSVGEQEVSILQYANVIT
jgi:hypothetical protein